MIELTMPRLADTMEQGTIVSWLKQDGERVRRGEDLVEIETDKATLTHQAEAAGVLEILAASGSTLRVGSPIARLGERHDGRAGAVRPSGRPAASSPPAPAPTVAVNGTPPAGAAATARGGAVAVRATPLARRLAAEHGLSLAEIAGTGPHRRITSGDVRARVRPAAPALRPTAEETEDHRSGEQVVELTRTQAVIAERMAHTHATVPHFQVEAEVELDAALALRAELASVAEVVPSLNDIVVKAAARALRAHPRVNGSFRDGRFVLHAGINVNVAVAAPGALLTPTVTAADARSLGDIAAETRRLAERVRSGTITPAELGGGTFTVSNLGMYGITSMTPILNAPQAAILGVGTVRAVPAVRNGELVERRAVTLTLTCDHRILYGADAAEFLRTLKHELEHPLRLALL